MTGALHPLKIAVIASSLRRAGAEKQTAYMTRALSGAGADVPFFNLGEGGYYESVLRQAGISLHRIYKPNRPLFILTHLCKALRRFQPDIVFAPQFGDLLQAGIAGRLCHTLVVGGVRSDGFYELNGHGQYSRWMLELAHGLVANSHRAWQNMASRGATPSKMKILPNVLDLEEFDAKSKLPPPVLLSKDRVVAAAVGSLLPSKRFDRFLNALALARCKAPRLLGVIAGVDAGCREALEQLARDLGLLPDHVIFLGECDNVPALLAHSHFLVLCSEYEGFPNVILEAMAAGLPVITTPAGDAPRIVIEDQTGFVVDGADIAAMASKMTDLALFSGIRLQMGTKGRGRVAAEYNYDYLPVRLLAIFREIAAQDRKPTLADRLQNSFPTRAGYPDSGTSAVRNPIPLTESLNAGIESHA